jgi:acyl-CoA thioester hydrolase
MLTITVDPQRFGAASITLAQQAWCGEQLLCEGAISIACVDRGTFRPCRIPTDILDSLTS